MPGLLPQVDPDGLLEYSVVYTDRALNHMSQKFQGVMRDISRMLKAVYHARSAIVVPGSGTFGMEAVARQFATGKKDLVFAPHVETAAGMILPDNYLRAVADAVHAVGGLLVLDCIASGAIWVDMAATGVDVLVSAPQKGWSGPPCCAFVMLSEAARARIDATTSTSFAADLKKWLQIMETYEAGGHAYHATLPTDALTRVRDAMQETQARGFETARAQQQALGDAVRALLERKGFKSVAAPGFKAPGVVVSYTDDAGLHSSKAFAAQGLQTAAGVPLMCDEPADFKTFRIGLFGLDKLANIERTVAHLERALSQVGLPAEPPVAAAGVAVGVAAGFAAVPATA